MQEKVFDHAYPVRLNFETETDITDGTVLIEYVKPDGTTGSWTATKDDAAAGTCYYDTQEDDLDLGGKWEMQAVHYPSGSNDGIPGTKVTLYVKTRLKAVT